MNTPRPCCLLLLILLLSLPCAAGAEPGGDAAPGPPGKPMLDAFLEREVRALASRSLEGIESREEWEARRPALREELREMLGLSPWPPRGDLHPVTTGKVDREDLGITVENLHFQSIPGLYVTANFYRPREAAGRLPAILYLCGHGKMEIDGVSYGNKTFYQHHPIWFARNGYACLVIDTLQLGEIQGKHHGTYSLGMWWWVSRGYTPAGVEAWNSIRALDYLESRPEVDPKRIGVTGRSGGGTGTWFLAALDDRPAALVPVAGITDLENHVLDGCIDGHCDCNYSGNLYRWDSVTAAAIAAPRPLLHSNSDKDAIFPLDGVIRVHEKLRSLYGLLGAREKLGLLITEGPHGDTQELQVPAFRWMDRWLKGEAPKPVVLAAEKLIDPRALKVFEKLPADERNTSIEESFVAAAPEPDVPRDPAAFDSLRSGLLAKLLGGALRSSPDPGAGLSVEAVADAEHDGLRLRGYSFTSEESFRLPLWVLSRAGSPGPSTMTLKVLDEDGWRDWLSRAARGFGRELDVRPPPDAPALEPPREGEGIAVFAPRGIGPTRWSPGSKRENQVRRRFLALGRTVEEARIHDVRRAVRALAAIPGLFGGVLRLEAERDMAAVSVYAGLLEPSVSRLELRQIPRSHRESVPLLGVLKALDIPQALALLFPREVVLGGVDDGAFGWTRKAAGLFAGAGGGGSPLTIVPPAPGEWIQAAAHAIPKHTTAEGSGYFSIIEGRNGRLYIGTAKYRENAYLVEFDPGTKAMRVVVDTMKEIRAAFPDRKDGTATGFAAQAKIHTRNNAGPSGKIYFATKQGYPKEGEKRSDYAGGYPMVYDPSSGTTRVYDIPVPHHGIISITPDEMRGVAYISTCSDERPIESTHFLVLDLETGKYRDLIDCRHMYAFVVVDHRGRAYHPMLGGKVARFDPGSVPGEGKLDVIDLTLDGDAIETGSLLAHEEGHPINWDASPDRRTLYSVAMGGNQLYAFDLAAEGKTLAGRSAGKLLPRAKETDCRALCAGPKGEVWAAVTGEFAGQGKLLHLVSYREGDLQPRDHGPIAIGNPGYTEFTGADGKPLPWHHGMRTMPDGTMTPQAPMGVCQGQDGTVYVTVIIPYTILEMRP